MRVLHVIPAVAARYGGPSVVAVSIVRALRHAGHDAMIATTDADGERQLSVQHQTATVWDGVPAIFFPRVASEAFKWAPGLAAWLGRHAGEFDVVDIHAVFSHSSIAAGRACRRAGVPYVVRPHGSLDPWSIGRKRFQKQAVMMAGARQLLSGAARMQYTTAAEQRLAEGGFAWLPPGAIVPLGVDDACFVSIAAPVDPPYVLAMSRIEAKKGIELLIDAFQAVASGPLANWRLVIAGDGAPGYVSDLRTRADGGAAAGRIVFPGWIEGADKQSLIRGASLFASPSTQENFGLSLMEAMAAGVPVVVSPGVNLADDIRAASAGWVVERDPRELAEQLRHILQQPDDRARRALAARGLAEGYRWNRSVDALLEVYRSAGAARNMAIHA